MADYISQYTGGQIDSAVGRALPGGTLESLIADKALGGFGYGGESLTAFRANSGESDAAYGARFDAVLDKMAENSTMQVQGWPPALRGYGHCFITIYKPSNDYVIVVGQAPYAIGASGYWRMVKEAGTWRPVEYSDPPMTLGVEYRTTDRYLGKPVYTMLFNCGNLPNSTTKTIEHGIQNIAVPISCTVQSNGNTPFTLPWISAERNAGGVLFVTNVRLYASNDMSTYPAYAILKYTKTTD